MPASGSTSEVAGTRAGKDCQTCNRRRISCDRTLPLCMKCSIKGLACPGYKRRFRWTNAIAVRGHLRGLTTPNIAQASTVLKPIDDRHGSPELSTQAVSGDDVTNMLERFTKPVISHLLQYYESEITPIMPWIDSPCNGYRRLVLPLAQSQPTLLLTILATAARHAGSDIGVHEGLLRDASGTAITMITLRLTELTTQDPNITTQNTVEPVDMQAIIAAVLVLSDCSLLQSNLDVAQFHREGIRTLLKTLTCMTDRNTEMFIFLQNEAAAYDVLACTTLFEIDRVRDAVLPGTQNSIFSGFLRVIHAITMRSLRTDRHSQSHAADAFTTDEENNDDSRHCPTSITGLENAFEAARGSTLLSASTLLQSASETSRHDFVCLVAAYHHAGLLYAYKRLWFIEIESSAYAYHLVRLFSTLEDFQDIRVVVSSLTWPLFIAGICSIDNDNRMQKIYKWFQLLVADTRYEHYNLLTDFLGQLQRDPHHDWIRLAKEYERRHQPIVAI